MVRFFGIMALAIAPLQAATVHAQTSPAKDFFEQVSTNFKKWDVDGNKELSKEEIDAVVANPKVVGKEAAAIASLKRAIRSSKSNPPTLAETSLSEAANASDKDAPNFGKMYAEGLSRLSKAKGRDLFEGGLPPKLDSLHQGKLGNCFCLAPLGAMLDRNPKQVADLFSVQADGTYKVTLGSRIVVIAPPTDAEIAMSSSNEQGCVWLNVYEKAAGEALNREREVAKQVGSPLDALAKGGSAGTMLSFITGHKIERFSCKYWKDDKLTDAEKDVKLSELRKMLAAATAEKRLMTCGTIKTTTPGMTPNHAYAILGYDAEKDSLRIWNPHGDSFTPAGPPGPTTGYARKDGVFIIPIGDFVRIFSGTAFELNETASE